MNPDRWLTSKRLLAHGLLVGLSIWTIYLWTLATPTLRDRNGNLKGTDFLHLYTLGTLAIEHRGDALYDTQAQASIATKRVSETKGIRYLPLYPPQVSILFAPLARLPYGSALAFWWFCSALIYGACCYRIWRTCLALQDFTGLVIVAALAFPAFFHLIAWGQTSALALACFTAGFLLLRGKREFIAGLALGCLIFKPQLGLAAVLVLGSRGRWRILAGAILSAALQIAVGILYYGRDSLQSWLRMLWQVPSIVSAFEPRIYQTHCLRTFWSMLVPWQRVSLGLYVISAAVVLAWTAAIWKRSESLSLKYSALLLATTLVSPHLTVYDLVILAPAILLLADWMVSHPHSKPGMGTLLYFAYVVPLFAPYTRWIHLQISVIVMTALLHLIWRIAKEEVALDSKTEGLALLSVAEQER